MRRRATAMAAAGLLAAGVAACGNGKVERANAYVEQVNAAQTEFARVSEDLLARVRPDEPSRANERLLARFVSEVEDLAARLRGIRPPEEVRREHEQLALAMSRFGERVRAAGRDIASSEPGRILDGQAELSDATSGVSREINGSIAAINAALRP